MKSLDVTRWRYLLVPPGKRSIDEQAADRYQEQGVKSKGYLWGRVALACGRIQDGTLRGLVRLGPIKASGEPRSYRLKVVLTQIVLGHVCPGLAIDFVAVDQLDLVVAFHAKVHAIGNFLPI